MNGSCEDRPAPDPSGKPSETGGSSSSAGSSTGGAAAGTGGVAGAGSTSAGGASGDGGDGTGGITVGSIPVPLEVSATALAVDPARGKLYATVRNSSPVFANELVVIDPEHAAVEASVALSAEPYLLAISDDATRLWVGIRGIAYQAPGTIREVDLTKWPPEPGREYAVPSLRSGRDDFYAWRMVALPGEPESIAVSVNCGACYYYHVIVMDSGTPRPNHAERAAPELAVGPPGYLFALDNRSTGLSFSTIAIDAAGATQTVHGGGFIDDFGGRLAYADGYVIAPSGHVVDVSAPESPLRAGTFAYEGEVIPHAEREEVVMLSYARPPNYSTTRDAMNQLVFRKLDLSTFRADFEAPLAGQYAEVYDFVEVKPDLFAFIAVRGEDYDTLNPRRSSVYLFSASDFAD